MSENVAVLVELDYCAGCYACQTACQEYNGLPVKETYMRYVLTKPERIDGDIVSHMSPVPLALNRCAECIEREGEAPCADKPLTRCRNYHEFGIVLTGLKTLYRGVQLERNLNGIRCAASLLYSRFMMDMLNM